MLPSGSRQWQGPTTVADAFGPWFGGAADFGDGWHVIEQQAYVEAGDTIGSLDLLCSGCHPEEGP